MNRYFYAIRGVNAKINLGPDTLNLKTNIHQKLLLFASSILVNLSK